MKKPVRKPTIAKPKKAAKPTKAKPAPLEMSPAFTALAKAFAKQPGVTCEKGWGAGNSVLKVKGKIFVMSVKEDLVAKVPKARAAELVESGAGKLFDPRKNGQLMKEWIVVAEGKANWLKLAREAHLFVSEEK